MPVRLSKSGRIRVEGEGFADLVQRWGIGGVRRGSALECTASPHVWLTLKAALGLRTTEAWQVELEEQAREIARIRAAADMPGDERLRPLQRVGVAFLRRVGRGILAYKMAAGKTPISLLAVQERPLLVVAPKYLTGQWHEEMRRWRPDLVPDAAVVGYEELVRRGCPLPHVGTLIADEAHRIAHRKTQRSQAVRRVARMAKHVFLLTGTPVRNRNDDLWALLHAIDPLTFSSYWRFAEMYCIVQEDYAPWLPGGFGRKILQPDSSTAEGREKLEALRRMLKFYLLQRTAEEVITEIPDLQRIDVAVPLAEQQRSAYEEAEDEMVLTLPTGELLDIPTILAKITRLRQLCVDPAMLGLKAESSRTEAVCDIVGDVLADGEQVVVFTSFAAYARLLADKLRAARITGDVPLRRREEEVRAFQEGRRRVLVGTTQAMGEGISLTAASTAVFADLPWTAAELEQAEARLRRYGQRSTVTVYRLYAPGTVETDIRRILQQKSRAEADIAQREPEEAQVLRGIVAALRQRRSKRRQTTATSDR